MFETIKGFLNKVDSLQLELVEKWHSQPPGVSESGLSGLIERQHSQNYLLWHEEDIARDPSVDEHEIARVKRSIDRLNQKRNDLIEQVDEAIIKMLCEDGITMDKNLPANSETPGSIMDRCSIMALKIYHMREQTFRDDVDRNHHQHSSGKLEILSSQRKDLFICLYQLIDEIIEGKRQFKVYRQFKMYNDPTLNPRIYGA